MRYSRYMKKKKVSLFAIISLSVFLFVYILLFIAKRDPRTADILNETVCHYFRFAMARLGGIFPFSLYEIIMLLIPVFVVIIVVCAVKSLKRGNGIRFIINFAAFVLLAIAGHNLSLGIGYHTTTIDEKMNLSKVEVTEDRLSEILVQLRDEINLLSGEITYESGTSRPNVSYDELNELLCDSYEELNKKYSFPKTFDSKAKQVIFGSLMSYRGITGIYTYFTGDANVNSAYPMYDIAFTTAHELSHQRGISRENEANFVAYLVTSASEDPYLRYSGALNMYQYVGNALYRTDPEKYREINAELSPLAKGDVKASYEVSEKYGDTIINDISTKINDLFLKSNGTDGVVTYGRVVTLAVYYFESMK